VVIRKNVGKDRWAAAVCGGLGACLIVAAACAGGDTPPRDAKLEETIRTTFDPDYASGDAGSASLPAGGSGGGGGSAAGGAGGGSSSTGGSASAGAAGSGSSGASGSVASLPPPTGPVCDAPTVVFQYGCGLGSGCHSASDKATHGDFGAGEAEARALLDVTTKNGCGKYIDSANPDASEILLKAQGKQGAGCGVSMPPNSNGVSQSDEDCIRSWVFSL
jgi:hypothetical protein